MLPLLAATLTLCLAPASDLTDKVTAKLEELRKGGSLPGMTAAWVLPNGTVETVAIGMNDKERQVAMKPTDRILAGSIGKTYFAAAIMKMVEKGQIDLDKKLEDYVGSTSWYKDLPNASTLTMRSLLTHTSGIPEHVEEAEFISYVKQHPVKNMTPSELLSFSLEKKPLFEVGKGWSYADTNYILAAFVAEKVGERKLYSVIEEEILKPLRLKETSPSTSPKLASLAQGYSMPNSPFGFSGPVLKDGEYWNFNPQMEWAGGGFISTSADLARWAKAMYEGKVVKPATVKQMVDAAVPARTGPGDKYGLGVMVRTSDLGPSYGHDGWFPGYLSGMEYFPDKKIAVAVQFNTDDFRALGARPRKYLLEVAKIVAGM